MGASFAKISMANVLNILKELQSTSTWLEAFSHRMDNPVIQLFGGTKYSAGQTFSIWTSVETIKKLCQGVPVDLSSNWYIDKKAPKAEADYLHSMGYQ